MNQVQGAYKYSICSARQERYYCALHTVTNMYSLSCAALPVITKYQFRNYHFFSSKVFEYLSNALTMKTHLFLTLKVKLWIIRQMHSSTQGWTLKLKVWYKARHTKWRMKPAGVECKHTLHCNINYTWGGISKWDYNQLYQITILNSSIQSHHLYK